MVAIDLLKRVQREPLTEEKGTSLGQNGHNPPVNCLFRGKRGISSDGVAPLGANKQGNEG